MRKVRVIGSDYSKDLQVEEGSTVLSVLQNNGFTLKAPCGGNGLCGHCRVNVNGKTVLACQYKVNDGDFIYLDEKLNQKVSNQKIDAAMDLGTTTIQVSIFDHESHQKLDEISFSNCLEVYGSDVISRVQYITNHSEGLTQLNHQLLTDIKRHLSPYGQVQKIIAAGNTIMQHIYKGISPESIASYPFTPQSLFWDEQDKEALLMPCVSGYVGGDCVSGVIGCEIDSMNETALLIDIGTNGEIFLRKNNQYYCCSFAAGPAFEGGNLQCGSNDISHSITHFNDIDDYQAEEANPSGITGSGYIDLVALLLENEVIEGSGRLVDCDECELKYSSRIEQTENGNLFRINPQLFLSSKDIRMLQMAIAATMAAIETMLIESDCRLEEIKRIMIAGSFGYHLNIENAIRIGLLPDCPLEKYVLVGNSSLAGVEKVYQDSECYQRALQISKDAKYIELSNSRVFQERYIENMCFQEEE